MSDAVNTINRYVPGLIEPNAGTPGSNPVSAPKESASFTDVFSEMLDSVNELHHDSSEIQKALLNGDPVELHEVMIKAREAGVATDLLLEIRNKLINAYSEIMRMPM
jgi:flagellar hook-basal body complex protein FliE